MIELEVRSNFRIEVYRDCRATLRLGGGAPLVTQYWGGAQNTFSYYNSLPTTTPTPWSLVYMEIGNIKK